MVQSVIEPLLNESGPLGDLSDRLKVLVGIGVVPCDIYHDIDYILHTKESLNIDIEEHNFTDTNIITALESLKLVNNQRIVPLELIESDEKSRVRSRTFFKQK